MEGKNSLESREKPNLKEFFLSFRKKWK